MRRLSPESRWPSLLGWLAVVGAVAAPVVLTSACSTQAEDAGASELGGGGPSSGSGAGGSDADASLDVSSGGGMPEAGVRDYSALCGLGECVPGGLAEDCAPGGNPGVGGGGGGEQMLFCQLTVDDGTPAPLCGPVGSIEAEGPCQSSQDCAPGLACVVPEGASAGGLCRPYCCGDLEACPEKTHCVPHPMIEEPEAPAPVCTPVTPCELLNDDACGPDQTCAVVRADGTTSCVPIEGDHELCEACPCAPGFVCSQVTGTCQKLCHTSDEYADECMGGTCQGGSESYPEGFGVCVGGPADCP